MMRKYRCPQCDIPSMYVKNADGERLLVYVYENGEVVPKDPTADLSGLDRGILPRMLMAWSA